MSSADTIPNIRFWHFGGVWADSGVDRDLAGSYLKDVTVIRRTCEHASDASNHMQSGFSIRGRRGL